MTFPVIQPCPSCGAKNRVPAAQLAGGARCGRCREALPAVAEPIDVGTEGFTDIITASPVPVLVDFWAAWCGPCRMAAPHVRALAAEMAGRALVLKVDTEAHPELAERYRVQAIPNFAVFRDGSLVRQQPGLAPPEVMRTWLVG